MTSSSIHRGIKSSSIWSRVKHLICCPSSLNKSPNISSVSYNLHDSGEVASIYFVAILHVLFLLSSSEQQIKKRKQDLKS
ncbi:hypothetical protein CR513_63048, partial [Mucuna pruriens]